MNVGNALKLTCVGIAGGIILRLVGLLYFFDQESGFYLGSGFYPWLSIGFVLLISALCAMMAIKDVNLGSVTDVSDKNIALGLGAIVSAAFLIYAGVLQLNMYLSLQSVEQINDRLAQSGAVHLFFIAATFAFALLQLVAGFAWIVGKSLVNRLPAVYLVAVLWGIAYLIFIFVYYAKSVLLVENMFMIFSSATLAISLFYLSKRIAGFCDQKLVKRFYAFGFFAVNLTMVYVVANAIAELLGNSYKTLDEIPLPVQIAGFGVAIFVLVFMFSVQYRSTIEMEK